MDAVKFLEVRKRMCSKLACHECPSSYEEDGFILCKAFTEHENFEEAVQIVEEWAKNNPVKTRQSEFLKHYPNTQLDDASAIVICPKFIIGAEPHNDGNGCACSCYVCRKKYWLEEVE